MLTITEAKAIDIKAQNTLKIPSIILMENAGKNAAEIADNIYSLKDKKITIFTGPGNNGGDGLVFARHAKIMKAHPTIYLLKDIKTPDAKINLDIAKHLNIPITSELPKETDLAIDAMLGIGIEGDPKEPIRTAIGQFNSMKCPKISLDCPSGLKTSTEAQPDITITFVDIKQGMDEKKTIITDIGF